MPIYVNKDETGWAEWLIPDESSPNPNQGKNLLNTTVEMRMTRAVNGNPVSGEDTKIVDNMELYDQTVQANWGRVRRQWETGDLSETGEYAVQFWITYPGGAVEKWPNKGYRILIVQEDIGGN